MDKPGPTADRELVYTRIYDAPRALVFAVWTDPKHIGQWWGPEGFTTTTHKMDVRPGGEWLFVMHGPDGTDYDNKIVYSEVVKPARLVYMHGEPGDPDHFEATITFEQLGAAKTKLTMRSVFRSAAFKEKVVREFGAIEGANQTLNRLGRHLADGRHLPSPPQGSLVLTRLIDAPRALVFAAWTEAEHVARWWGPKGFTNPVCEIDARVGGKILIHMKGPGGLVHVTRGVFEEFVRPERIAFVNNAEDESGNRLIDGFTIVTFAEEGGKTRLTLDTRVVGIAAESPAMLGGMEAGWGQSIDRLAELVLNLAGGTRT